MSKKSKFIILILSALVFASLLSLLFAGTDMPVLNPKGEIADKERSLIIFASLLSLIVVIPVYLMTFIIVYKYRVGNRTARYRPNWDSNKFIEGVWWAVPIILITILSVVTWRSTHQLEPSKPLATDAKPLNIQVVALQWKWLFIYPEQNIATINYVQVPVGTPVKFHLTADAPMNSLWIPSLGSQMYAMSGMSTELNLIADKAGDYQGSSANISGRGFAGMKFTARAGSQQEFDQWVQAAKIAPRGLTWEEYEKLAEPSENNPPAYYQLKDKNLYDKVVGKYERRHD